MLRTIAGIAAMVLLGAAGAGAQTRSATRLEPGHSHTPGSPGSAQPGGAMMHPEMTGEMCPMMSGMRMTEASDPKAMARMLRLRGDMMKAMGEVMLKHAQKLEQGK